MIKTIRESLKPRGIRTFIAERGITKWVGSPDWAIANILDEFGERWVFFHAPDGKRFNVVPFQVNQAGMGQSRDTCATNWLRDAR